MENHADSYGGIDKCDIIDRLTEKLIQTNRDVRVALITTGYDYDNVTVKNLLSKMRDIRIKIQQASKDLNQDMEK